jgi:RNA polymerase sigma factor (sigma-70 family)
MDEEEFKTKVVSGCEGLIYGLCRKFHIKGYDLDDKFQAVIEELWIYREDYNDDYKVTTWVHMIGKRKLIGLLRYTNRQKRGGEDEHISMDIEIGENCDTQLKDMLTCDRTSLIFENKLAFFLYEAIREDLERREMSKRTKNKTIDLLDLLWFNLTEEKKERDFVSVKKEIAGFYCDTLSSIDWVLKNHLIPVAKKYI